MSRFAGRLPVSPSLNRAVLGSFTGLPDGVAGHRANTWLTSWAVARRMAERPEVAGAAAALGAPLAVVTDAADLAAVLLAAPAPWPRRLDALVAAGQESAVALADDLGAVLGALVATLVTGPKDSRGAQPDWPPERWARWSRVQRLALGGGLLSGELGRRMTAQAAYFLGRQGVPTTLTLVRDPVNLALRGAASLLRDGGVAVDCGGTSIKGARVGSSGVADLPSRPAPSGLGASGVVAVLADAIASAMPESQTAEVSLCIATYVDDSGQPYSGQPGPYAPLGDIAFVPTLQAAVRDRTRADPRLHVTHDGRAALLGARVDDPDVDAAVVLGTSIGSGLDPRS